MSYTSDQFYQFTSYEGTNKSISRKQDDNPNFNYPSRLDHPLGVDTGPVQRGFIRGIYPAALGKVASTASAKVKQRRLFFQFNPTTLDRTVQMSTSVLNPLLQDPSNLLQPVPGMSDFSFDMLFNRESEVVTGKYTNSAGNRTKATSFTGALEDYGSATKPDDVSTLGVLADLYVLDSIIGQSISQDMVDFLKSYWNNASNLSQSTYTAGNGSASFSFNDTAFETTVKKNLGNAAFLSPLPIRIVFSSMFMVEGFVTASSVQFIKFTSSYVPVICKVTLNIRALYIGFAREKAYLTDALETAVADQVETAKNDTLKRNAMSLLTKSIFLEFVPKPYNLETFIVNTIAFQANRDRFSTEHIDAQLIPEPGLFSTGSSETTFRDWWENARPEYQTVWEGWLYSGVSKGLQQELKSSGVTWSFDARFEINKNLDFTDPNSPSGGKNLVNTPLSYKKKNGSKRDDVTGIVEGANKYEWFTPDPISKKNTDIWYFSADWPKNEEFSATDKVTFSIFVTITLSYTDSTGATTVTKDIASHHTINAASASDWSKITSGQIKWQLWERTGGQSTVVPRTR